MTYFMNAKIQIFPIMPMIQLYMPLEKISELQSLAFRLFKWFENNHMKANPGKSDILLSNKKTEKVTTNDVVLTSSVEEILLRITFDSELEVRPSPSTKKLFYLLQWKTFINDEKCFLFHLKSSFRSQGI